MNIYLFMINTYMWKSSFIHITLLLEWNHSNTNVSISNVLFTFVCQTQLMNDLLMPDYRSKKKKKTKEGTKKKELVSKCHEEDRAVHSALSSCTVASDLLQYTCDMYAFDLTCWIFYVFHLDVGLYCLNHIFNSLCPEAADTECYQQCLRVCL